MTLREQIARLIEPGHWHTMDDMSKNVPPEIRDPLALSLLGRSLRRADALLPLLPALPPGWVAAPRAEVELVRDILEEWTCRFEEDSLGDLDAKDAFRIVSAMLAARPAVDEDGAVLFVSTNTAPENR